MKGKKGAAKSSRRMIRRRLSCSTKILTKLLDFRKKIERLTHYNYRTGEIQCLQITERVRLFEMIILETKGLKKYYGEGESLVKALDNVNLKVEQGGGLYLLSGQAAAVNPHCFIC